MTYRAVFIAVIVLLTVAMGISTIASKEPRPRHQDGKEYRQWCCQRCETWNSDYGPPYRCKKCGKTMDW